MRRHFVPFSSFHRYQRTDSVWANAWTTPVADYARGFRSDRVELLPAFVRYDCTTDTWEAIDPPAAPDLAFPPGRVRRRLVGVARRTTTCARWRGTSARSSAWRARSTASRSASVATSTPSSSVGATPGARSRSRRRARRCCGRSSGRSSTTCSSATSCRPRCTVAWPTSGLYPDFTPYVTKYADNGRARTADELRAYFAEYRRRLGLTTWLRSAVEQRAKDGVRARVAADSPLYRTAKQLYTRAKRVG